MWLIASNTLIYFTRPQCVLAYYLFHRQCQLSAGPVIHRHSGPSAPVLFGLGGAIPATLLLPALLAQLQVSAVEGFGWRVSVGDAAVEPVAKRCKNAGDVEIRRPDGITSNSAGGSVQVFCPAWPGHLSATFPTPVRVPTGGPPICRSCGIYGRTHNGSCG